MKLKIGEGRVSADVVASWGLAAALTAVTTAIGTLVLAAVKIKLILVVALAHPILAVVVGIAAILACLGLRAAAKEAAESIVRNHEFNKVTLQMLQVCMREGTLREKLARAVRRPRPSCQRSAKARRHGHRGGGQGRAGRRGVESGEVIRGTRRGEVQGCRRSGDPGPRHFGTDTVKNQPG